MLRSGGIVYGGVGMKSPMFLRFCGNFEFELTCTYLRKSGRCIVFILLYCMKFFEA